MKPFSWRALVIEKTQDRSAYCAYITRMTLEKFIADLNSLAFFKEFTFSKNKFMPAAGGTELELADNLVWVGNDLTILQLKERSTADVVDAESETKWFKNKVLGKATKQIRDTLEFLEDNISINVTNEQGHSFDIKRDELAGVTKVVVFLPGKIVPEIARSTTHYLSQSGGFIHILSAKNYLGICHTLRVPADIRDYFSYRQRLFEKENGLSVQEPLILGQYLSGNEAELPSNSSYQYLTALEQNLPDFDLSPFLANLRSQIEHQHNPFDYYEILRQFARLPRSGWKESKTRIEYCIEALKTQKFRKPTRFAWPELSLGFVFFPMDPELMQEKNMTELMQNGLLNFTLLHKHEQRLDCCVGLVVAKDRDDFLLNWCVMKSPWSFDQALDEKLKDQSPFLEVKEKVISRFKFK